MNSAEWIWNNQGKTMILVFLLSSISGFGLIVPVFVLDGILKILGQ